MSVWMVAPLGAWSWAHLTRHFRAGLSRSAPAELGLGCVVPRIYRQIPNNARTL